MEHVPWRLGEEYGKSRSSATLPACHRRQALNLISDEPSAASPPIWQNLHKEMATARQADVWCGIWIERNGAFSQMCRGVTWAPGIGGAQLACRWINLSTPSTPQGRFSGVLAQNNPPFWFNPDAQSWDPISVHRKTHLLPCMAPERQLERG